MKILYLGHPSCDYEQDMLFHGLRELFGPDVVDANRLWYMFKGASTKELYGKGMTLFGLIEEGAVDRTDILSKIKAKYFDFVIFGSIQREYALLGEVKQAYDSKRIIMIDGEDGPLFLGNAVHHGIYFKRELHSPQNKVWPIHFAIPSEKLCDATQKTKFMAFIDPMDTTTYIYDNEADYYADYRSSLFGRTQKKAGWDCLRHYEIMANFCLPYFVNLEFCPDTIMTRLPKKELLVAKTMLEYKDGKLFHSSEGERLWSVLMHEVFEKLRTGLTTSALAKYVLDTAMSLQ